LPARWSTLRYQEAVLEADTICPAACDLDL